MTASVPEMDRGLLKAGESEHFKERSDEVRRSLHESAFATLRDSRARNPWEWEANEVGMRTLVGSMIMGTSPGGPGQDLPEYAQRLNLKRTAGLKSKLKILMGAEAAYDKYTEALALVEGIRRREEVAQRWRHKILARQPGVTSTVSDDIYHLELEELMVKRGVAMSLNQGVDPGEASRMETGDESERVALLAASTVQPVVRVVLQTALKHGKGSAAEPGVLDLVNKKLGKSAGAQDVDRALLKEGLTALREKSMAMASLCENLRVENRESHLATLSHAAPPALGGRRMGAVVRHSDDGVSGNGVTVERGGGALCQGGQGGGAGG
jgi:hypothetical protein